jgi:uncharacterized membrane protein YdjX (TVP38/TMEM64 family)
VLPFGTGLDANHDELLAYVALHRILALGLFALSYVAAVALSLPVAVFLSLLGGFLFGWLVGGATSVLAATIGAVIVFLIVRTSLGSVVAARAGPYVTKLSDGFKRNAFSYLLFLRLVPGVPFFAVNAVAGLVRVKPGVFALSTLIGIVPGGLVYAWIGRGLGDVIGRLSAAQAACLDASPNGPCPVEFSALSLLSPQLVWAFAALSVLALLPLVVKFLKAGP